MTAFLIGAAELAALAAGTPMIVATPNLERLGLEGTGSLPITVLRPVDGVLRQADGPPGPALPLPPGLRPLASVAADAAGAVALAAGLPPGIPALPATGLMPALVARLVAALAEAEAQRGALQRRLSVQPVAAPRRVIDLPPVPTGPAPPPRAMQPLGRGAEGLCGVALHVAVPASEAASLLRVRLVTGGRIIGAWTVPGRDLVPGWLALDLPEPAPAGSGEAHLEIALDAAAGDRVRIASGGQDAGAPLALRVETAEPGHLRAPRHFDWAMRDLPAPAPGVVLALPDGAWAAATLQGATADRIALGPEPPRLLLAIAPGAEARLSLPPLPAGPADLVMLDASLRLGDATQVEVALLAAAAEATDNPRHSGWRRVDAEGRLRVALPLPATPSGAIALRVVIRNAGPAASIEVARLALATGAAGVPRRDPAESAPEAQAPAASPAPQAPTPSVAEPPKPTIAEPPKPPVAEPPKQPAAEPPKPPAAEPPTPTAAQPPTPPAAQPPTPPAAQPPTPPAAEPPQAARGGASASRPAAARALRRAARDHAAGPATAAHRTRHAGAAATCRHADPDRVHPGRAAPAGSPLVAASRRHRATPAEWPGPLPGDAAGRSRAAACPGHARALRRPGARAGQRLPRDGAAAPAAQRRGGGPGGPVDTHAGNGRAAHGTTRRAPRVAPRPPPRGADRLRAGCPDLDGVARPQAEPAPHQQGRHLPAPGPGHHRPGGAGRPVAPSADEAVRPARHRRPRIPVHEGLAADVRPLAGRAGRQFRPALAPGTCGAGGGAVPARHPP
ncbi:DUF6212 domain-containing protein [Falsiroseomonas stagni]|uniref:DUF6212 domain-containing protein n=1 Tax=Falsiroseomonas stagni TaxID=484882 RepID=UPI001113B10D|nr:DUF6212 domain-containing protein [Falsiroseomonas stagni]